MVSNRLTTKEGYALAALLKKARLKVAMPKSAVPKLTRADVGRIRERLAEGPVAVLVWKKGRLRVYGKEGYLSQMRHGKRRAKALHGKGEADGK